MIKNKSKNYIFCLLIAVYCILMVTLLTGPGKLYGSMVDWLSQHSVFPEMFRQSFYESKQLIPNFFFQIGGGQNAFHFTYYGFLSPVILLSYLLPFVDMTVYIICASIILYLSSGILAFLFLKKHFGELRAFAASLLFVSLPAINFHFHHHLMFVWYLPFLLLSLMGLDRFFDKKKPLLFIVSVFLMILTNYYFSVGSLVCLFIYAIYNVLHEKDLGIKDFFYRAFRVIFIFVIPVLLSAFVLAPTAYGLLANGRAHTVKESLRDLFCADLEEVFFSPHGLSLSGIFIVCAIGNLFAKGLKKSEAFLNGVLVFAVVCPMFSFALNGFLYARGKVLIPFAILYIYSLCAFIKNLEEKRIDLRKNAIAVLLLAALFILVRTSNYRICIAIAISLAVVVLLRRYPKYIYIFSAAGLIFTSFYIYSVKEEEYVTKEYYDTLYKDEICELMESAEDDWYRSCVYYRESNLVNNIYSDNYFGTSVYSSTANSAYQDFYVNYMGNNQRYRNCFILSGARNELFYTYMGTRYIISASDPGFLYEAVASSEHLKLYKNTSAYPIVYKSTALASSSQLEKLQFPYTTELLMTHTLTEDSKSSAFKSQITPISVDDSYQFINEKTVKSSIQLDDSLKGKLLYLSFDIVNEGDFRNNTDISITINGICNKLTKDTWMYYNGNTSFDYVIPLESTNTLKITASAGKFNIQNVRMYSSPVITADHEEVKELQKDTFSDKITCSVTAEDGEYLVTSIPFDKGFTASINGEACKVEKVNNSFVGLRLHEGENNIVISYTSPLFNIGILASFAGVILLIYELLKKHIDPLLLKYRELVMYLVFGVLTTAVSLLTYFLCTKLGLDAQDPLKLQIANVISWIVSVTFAYVTNKLFIFHSKNSVLKESIKFYLSRLGTLIIDMVLMYLLVTLGGINDMVSKLAVQIIVIVSNYVISKFLVFREKVKE